jgi:hypothetical protein
MQPHSSYCRQCGGQELLWSDRTPDDGRNSVTVTVEIAPEEIAELIDGT